MQFSCQHRTDRAPDRHLHLIAALRTGHPLGRILLDGVTDKARLR